MISVVLMFDFTCRVLIGCWENFVRLDLGSNKSMSRHLW